MTLVAGRPTLADVDALRLMAALNPREADDETLLCRLAPFLWRPSRRRFQISSNDGENAASVRSR